MDGKQRREPIRIRQLLYGCELRTRHGACHSDVGEVAEGYGYPIVGSALFFTRVRGIRYRGSAASLDLVDRADR